jgi:hypothetical protein
MVFRKFWEYVEKSILGGVSNKVSTTRISSYLILGSILATGFVYLLIDIINAIIKWNKGEVFIISTEDLIFFKIIQLKKIHFYLAQIFQFQIKIIK